MFACHLPEFQFWFYVEEILFWHFLWSKKNLNRRSYDSGRRGSVQREIRGCSFFILNVDFLWSKCKHSVLNAQTCRNVAHYNQIFPLWLSTLIQINKQKPLNPLFLMVRTPFSFYSFFHFPSIRYSESFRQEKHLQNYFDLNQYHFQGLIIKI